MLAGKRKSSVPTRSCSSFWNWTAPNTMGGAKNLSGLREMHCSQSETWFLKLTSGRSQTVISVPWPCICGLTPAITEKQRLAWYHNIYYWRQLLLDLQVYPCIFYRGALPARHILQPHGCDQLPRNLPAFYRATPSAVLPQSIIDMKS